ncbi:MAG: hypothetical protein B7733_05675, partial [Myxococcales bacterium FL481]
MRTIAGLLVELDRFPGWPRSGGWIVRLAGIAARRVLCARGSPGRFAPTFPFRAGRLIIDGRRSRRVWSRRCSGLHWFVEAGRGRAGGFFGGGFFGGGFFGGGFFGGGLFGGGLFGGGLFGGGLFGGG